VDWIELDTSKVLIGIRKEQVRLLPEMSYVKRLARVLVPKTGNLLWALDLGCSGLTEDKEKRSRIDRIWRCKQMGKGLEVRKK